jgi:hypothetical protein
MSRSSSRNNQPEYEQQDNYRDDGDDIHYEEEGYDQDQDQDEDQEEGELMPSIPLEAYSSSEPRVGSYAWIQKKAEEMRSVNNASAAAPKPAPPKKTAAKRPARKASTRRRRGVQEPEEQQEDTQEEEEEQEDPVIKSMIEKLKAQTIMLHQPDTGITEPEYQGKEHINTYTPPILPALEFANQTSREELLRIFKERATALTEAQGEQKLNSVVGDYIRGSDGEVVSANEKPLRWPKTAIFYLAQGLDATRIDSFVKNIGYIHEWIEDNKEMMKWIEELQKKPSEFTVSDIASANAETKITELKKELRSLRAVFAESPVNINVDKLTGLGQMLYTKIIGGSGAGVAGSSLANFYTATYRYVAKDILKYNPDEMSQIDADPTTLEQVYMNYILSIMTVCLLILILPSYSEILGPWLDALKSVISSFIVIRYSDLIGLVVGESVSSACKITAGIEKRLQDACQITKTNIDEIKRMLFDVFDKVDQPEVIKSKFITLKQLIAQSDRPAHEEERRQRGLEATGMSMRGDSEEQAAVFRRLGGRKTKKNTKRQNKTKSKRKLKGRKSRKGKR